jgi:hypothetical protein
MQPIIKNLLKTFAISTVLAYGANCFIYVSKMEGLQYSHKAAALSMGLATLVVTIIALILSLPALLLMMDKFLKYIIVCFLLYFTGPLLLLIALVFMQLEPTDQLLGQLTVLIYLAVTTYFYYLFTKIRRKKLGIVETISASERLKSRIDPL